MYVCEIYIAKLAIRVFAITSMNHVLTLYDTLPNDCGQCPIRGDTLAR